MVSPFIIDMRVFICKTESYIQVQENTPINYIKKFLLLYKVEYLPSFEQSNSKLWNDFSPRDSNYYFGYNAMGSDKKYIGIDVC